MGNIPFSTSYAKRVPPHIAFYFQCETRFIVGFYMGFQLHARSIPPCFPCEIYYCTVPHEKFPTLHVKCSLPSISPAFVQNEVYYSIIIRFSTWVSNFQFEFRIGFKFQKVGNLNLILLITF